MLDLAAVVREPLVDGSDAVDRTCVEATDVVVFARRVMSRGVDRDGVVFGVLKGVGAPALPPSFDPSVLVVVVDRT